MKSLFLLRRWTSLATAFQRLAVLVLLCVGNACAEGGHASTEQKALLAIAPEFRHLALWEAAEGDLNGDGLLDIAVLLTGSKDNAPREERLFVLVGNTDGSYQVLSTSGDFCHHSKFYYQDIEKGSLFVQVFTYEDSARAESFTLQFRHSAKLADMELIGEESLRLDYENDARYRISSNYLTKSITYSRHAKKKHKQVKARLIDATTIRLQGFECFSRGSGDPGIYIDENFEVHKPLRAP